jgi:muconate cycloisomerase
MEVYPTSLRFKRGFQISRGTIGGVGVPAPHILVTLAGSEGTVGWGESRPSHLWSYETAETVTSTLEGYLRKCIEGEDPADLEALHDRMDSVIAPGVTRGQPIAKSSLDISAHDLICKAEGVSLSEHLGGSPHADVALSYLISASSGGEASKQVRSAMKDGYKGFKIKIGKGVDKDLEIISACREAAGGAFLWADANQAYGLEDATRLSREAGRSDLQVLEQPLMSTDRHGLIRLSEASPVEIAIDESVFTHEDLLDFISLGFEGGVVIKTAKSGGILPAKRMIDLAMASGLTILGSGLTESMVGFSASLQLFHAAGMEIPVDLNGPQFIHDHLSTGPVVEGGRARVSGPGLGVDVDEERLREEKMRRQTPEAS